MPNLLQSNEPGILQGEKVVSGHVMSGGAVPEQLVLLSGGVVTMKAGIRLDTRVNANVSNYFEKASELLIARVTRERAVRKDSVLII